MLGKITNALLVSRFGYKRLLNAQNVNVNVIGSIWFINCFSNRSSDFVIRATCSMSLLTRYASKTRQAAQVRSVNEVI